MVSLALSGPTVALTCSSLIYLMQMIRAMIEAVLALFASKARGFDLIDLSELSPLADGQEVVSVLDALILYISFSFLFYPK